MCIRDSLKRMENAASALGRIAEHCRELNLGIVLENMLPHLTFGHVRELLWIMGAMNQPRVGLCLDTGHAHLSGDLQNVAHKLGGHLRMIHANDNKGNYDDHLSPGDGHIDWRSLVSELSNSGFKGAMILEIAGGRAPEQVLEDARRGRLFLRRLSREFAVCVPPEVTEPDNS